MRVRTTLSSAAGNICVGGEDLKPGRRPGGERRLRSVIRQKEKTQIQILNDLIFYEKFACSGLLNVSRTTSEPLFINQRIFSSHFSLVMLPMGESYGQHTKQASVKLCNEPVGQRRSGLYLGNQTSLGKILDPDSVLRPREIPAVLIFRWAFILRMGNVSAPSTIQA